MEGSKPTDQSSNEKSNNTDSHTVQIRKQELRELYYQVKRGDMAAEDLVDQLWDEVRTVRPLDEFVRTYLNERGQDKVAQLSIEISIIHQDRLSFFSYTGASGDLPEIVRETDEIRVGSETFPFNFRESGHGPMDNFFRVTIYASDNIPWTDGQSVEKGLESVKSALEERTIALRTLCERAISEYDPAAMYGSVGSTGDKHNFRIDIFAPDNQLFDSTSNRFGHVREITDVGDDDLDGYGKVQVHHTAESDWDTGTALYVDDDHDDEPVSLDDGLDNFAGVLNNQEVNNG